jgi:hypothetical protein
MSESEAPVQDRRGFLKNVGVAAAAVAVLSRLRGDAPPPREQPKPPAEKLSWASGETIQTPIVPVTIDGWSLKVSNTALASYGKDHPRNDALFRFANRRVGVAGPVVTKANTVIGDTSIMFGLPSKNTYDPYAYLSLTQSEPGPTGHALTTYPIEFRYFTDQSDKQGPRFYSEVPLPETRLQEITKELSVFAELLSNPPLPLYIHNTDTPKDRGGNFDNQKYEVHLPKTVFAEPLYANEGIMLITHEFAHGVLDRVLANRSRPEVTRSISEAYEDWVRAAKQADPQNTSIKLPMPSFSASGVPESIENNPVFSLFDESNYVKPINPPEGYDSHGGHGHPFSNYSELFASATSVLRWHPEEFIKRYTELPDEFKPVMNNVVQQVFNVYGSFGYPDTSDQPIKDAFDTASEVAQKMFPQFEKIKDICGITKITN